MDRIGKLKYEGFTESNDRYRLAAQHRRIQENIELEKLSAELPISKAISGKHIDKATVVRLAATYIHLNSCLSGINDIISPGNYCAQPNQPKNISVLEALNGFVLCFTPNGEILYISETISIYLGLSQLDLTGNSIEQLIHPDDIQRFYQVLSMIYHEPQPVMINLRIKSTLTKRLRKESLCCTTGFEVVAMNINICYTNNQNTNEHYYAAFGQALSTTLSTAIPLDYQSFVVITDENLFVRIIDSRFKKIDQNPITLQIQEGMSFYKFVFMDDFHIIKAMHFETIKFGASITPYYRLTMNDCSSTVYAQTQAVYLSIDKIALIIKLLS